MTKVYAGGFFYNPKTKEVLLHQRDGNTNINPHKWACFGGAGEEGETPTQSFIREIKEELGVTLAPEEVKVLCDYLNPERGTHRYIFYVLTDRKKSEMALTEGAGFDWIPIDKVFEYDLTEKTVRDLHTLIATV